MSDDLVIGIQHHLKASGLGWNIIHLPVTDSTNDVAKSAAQDGAEEGLVVLADRQTAGRGRMGRTWHGSGGSLLMSLLLRPSFPPSRIFALTMLSATAIREAVCNVCGLRCDLKWPNDLLLRGKKLGGILTEASFRGEQIDYAIVGIGLNINLDVREYPDISDIATSLSAELGRPLDRGEFLGEILGQIAIRYGWAQRGELNLIHQEWRSALAHLGRSVSVVDRGQVLQGIAEDVDTEGTLIVRRRDGALVRVVTGDVSLVPE